MPPERYLFAVAVIIWNRKLPFGEEVRGAIVAVIRIMSLGWLGGLLGPLLVLPAGVATTCTILGLQLSRRVRPWLALIGLLAIALDFAPELTGQPSAYEFGHDRVVIHPTMVYLPATRTFALRVASAIIPLVVGVHLVNPVRGSLDRAEQRLFLQAWHLRRFLPTAPRDATEP